MSNELRFNALREFKKQLDSVSPTFCTAKWTQSTILLYNGETHSCHHPARHKIPLEGLDKNPKLIHNTPIKIHARKDLLNGIQTKECDYCWRIENMGTDHTSDRIYKSANEIWGRPFFQSVLDSGLGEEFEPTYLEVAFESTCNFACMYCSPEVSTRWMEDAESNGPYELAYALGPMHSVHWMKSQGQIPIRHDEYNPYIEAFWKWWPEVYPTLKTFRITGGEPLLSKHTWKVFDWIKNNPQPDLEFAINTNLNVPRKLIDKLVAEIKNIESNVRCVKIFTSVEATGRDAEYIRYGMNYDEFMANLDYVMSELPTVRVAFMVTTNALSIFTFKNFLEEVLKFRTKHVTDAGYNTLGLGIHYLRWPVFMDIRMMNKDLMKPLLDEMVEFIEYHGQKRDDCGEGMFYLEEIDMMKRLREYAMQEMPNRSNEIENFRMFFEQYDHRRKLSLYETFPNIDRFLE